MSREEIRPGVTPGYRVGDRVTIKNYNGKPGKIVELRGRLGPNGCEIYRVLLQRKPRPAYVELRGDQFELAPSTPAALVVEEVEGDPKVREIV